MAAKNDDRGGHQQRPQRCNGSTPPSLFLTAAQMGSRSAFLCYTFVEYHFAAFFIKTKSVARRI
jgi:hypothetical protein